MKNLKSLSINPAKLLSDQDLVQLKGGYDQMTFTCCCGILNPLIPPEFPNFDPYNNISGKECSDVTVELTPDFWTVPYSCSGLSLNPLPPSYVVFLGCNPRY